MTDFYPSGRWTPHRKALLVDEIRAGQLSRETAMLRHAISPDELEGWIARYARFGERGLSIKRLQEMGR